MKEKKLCGWESRRAHQFNASSVQLANRLNRPWGCSPKRLQVDHFMVIRIFLGLCVVLGAGCISVRAADNPAQAAARVALEQKLSQPDAWEPQPLTPATTPSVAVVKQPVKSAANVTGTVSKKAVTPQTAQAPTTPMAAPAAAAPDRLLLIMSLLIISFLTMSFLLLKLLRQNSRHYGSDQASTSSRT
jgi:hypothetical protein